VRIETDPSHVTITMSPVETVLAFRRRLKVPVDEIASVVAMDRSDLPIGPLVRAPGTHIPGLIRYGSYGLGENRQFWAFVRRSRVLVIDTPTWEYSRIVLSTRDPGQVAGAIGAVLRK
jgi:hypothetical protein